MSTPRRPPPEHPTARTAYEAMHRMLGALPDDAAAAACTLVNDHLNPTLSRLARLGVSRQAIADFVQTWATTVDADDDERKGRRS